MPTIANQQHSIQPPTEQTAAIEASNFGRSMNPDCFFEITGDFGAVRFFSNTRSETWPPISPTVSVSVHGRKKNKKSSEGKIREIFRVPENKIWDYKV